jgi:hypothetical protein
MISDSQKDQKLGGSCTPDQLRGYHDLIIGYDVSGQQEEKRNNWLRVELKKVQWLSHSSPSRGKSPTNFSELDVGEFIRRLFGGPPGVECDVGLVMDKSPATSGSDSTPFCHSRMLLSGILEKDRRKIPAFAGMTGIPKRIWSPPLGKPPTGFSELDVGEFIHRLFDEPPDVECDVGRMLDDLVSSELETTRWTDDEVRNGCCLTMDSRRFQLCQN